MFATRIFRDKRREEGREEGRREGRQMGREEGLQEGRQEMKALLLRAISERREGETAEQAIERVLAEAQDQASR